MLAGAHPDHAQPRLAPERGLTNEELTNIRVYDGANRGVVNVLVTEQSVTTASSGCPQPARVPARARSSTSKATF